MSLPAKTLTKGTKVTAPVGDGYEVDAVVEEAGYRVRWDDGSGTHWVAFDKVKFEGDAPVLSKIPDDTRAKAEWSDGSYYGVTVEAGGYRVRFPDTDAHQWVVAGRVASKGAVAAAKAGDFEVGAHVQGVWTNGKWYGGTVREFDGERYLIAWDDGSTPSWRERQHVMED